jgi:predicted dehydrogenase
MAAPIRVAILSFAHYHANFWAEAFRDSPLAEFVGMQSFPKRFDPVNHELRRMIRRGELGRILLARIRHGHFHGLDPHFTSEWHMDPVLGGGGALLDEGIHGADLIRWLFGEPECVTAMTSDAALALPVEDVAVALFRFRNGLLAELSASCAFVAGDNSVEVYGTEGAAVVSGVDLASRDVTPEAFLKIYRVGQSERRWDVSPIIPRFKTGGFHQQNLLHFLEAISQGAPSPVTLEDGQRALAMILAAYRSARTGQTQPIR